jgi:hypothetical protein
MQKTLLGRIDKPLSRASGWGAMMAAALKQQRIIGNQKLRSLNFFSPARLQFRGLRPPGPSF